MLKAKLIDKQLPVIRGLAVPSVEPHYLPIFKGLASEALLWWLERQAKRR